MECWVRTGRKRSWRLTLRRRFAAQIAMAPVHNLLMTGFRDRMETNLKSEPKPQLLGPMMTRDGFSLRIRQAGSYSAKVEGRRGCEASCRKTCAVGGEQSTD